MMIITPSIGKCVFLSESGVSSKLATWKKFVGRTDNKWLSYALRLNFGVFFGVKDDWSRWTTWHLIISNGHIKTTREFKNTIQQKQSSTFTFSPKYDTKKENQLKCNTASKHPISYTTNKHLGIHKSFHIMVLKTLSSYEQNCWQNVTKI